MIVQFILLTLGFVILIFGADWLVKGSVSLAKHFHVPEIVIGLTIVAFGTSSPELVVSIISSLQGYADVTLGNVVGSNIFNLMFILGLAGLMYPLSVQIKTIWNEIPLSLFAAVVLFLIANYMNINQHTLFVGRMDGIILLAFFVLFMAYISLNLKKGNDAIDVSEKKYKPGISGALILIGLGALVWGSRLVVNNAVNLAQEFGASEKLIGITIVSAGTSLPELVTSVIAAMRKKSDIAVGNVIGSNIFNIFFILGLSAVISPIPFNVSFNVDILLLIIATTFLFLFMYSGKRYRLDRWESAIFLVGYIGYIIFLLV